MKSVFLIVAAVLAAAVALMQWTAAPPPDPAAVRLVWATDDNPLRQEQMAAFRAWYQQKYGVPIDIVIDPANNDASKIIVQSVVGAGPDLFDYSGPIGLRSFVESGVILDVTDAAHAENFGPDRFWPVLESSIAFRGRQYGVPDNVSCPLILADADLLESKGLQPPAPGWTWRDLVSLGQALSQDDAQGRRVRYGLIGIDWADLILQNGGAFFNPSETRCVLNSPESVEALQFYADLRNKYHIVPSGAELASMAEQGGYGNEGNFNLFAGGRGAMISFGRYGYIMIRNLNAERLAAGKRPLRVVPLPPLGEKRTVVTATGRCTGVNRKSQHRAEAVRFLEFLASREFNDLINRRADSLNAMPEYDANGISGSGSAEPGCDDAVWTQAMANAVPQACSPFLNGAVQRRILLEEIDRLVNGVQTPAEAAARMEARLNRAIAEYLKPRPDLRREWERLDAVPSATP